MHTCKTCELIANRDAGTVPLWDCIYRTPLWDVAHSYNTSLPGWLVLVARRHTVSLNELAEPEAIELGRLIRQVSPLPWCATRPGASRWKFNSLSPALPSRCRIKKIG